MRRMLQISPKDMSKEKNSKFKVHEKSEKRNIHNKARIQRKIVSPLINLNPVVLLNRLPNDYRKVLAESTPRRFNAFDGNKLKGQLKNHGSGKKKNSVRRSEWPLAYEGCSYDDSLVEEASVFLNNLSSEEGTKEDKDEPEVDIIDGVKFLSFLHEPDIRKYSCFLPSYDTFFSDWGSENSRDSSFSDDFKQLIIPTKTRDITQIKGWRKKLFGDCNEYATMSPEENNAGEHSPKGFYDSENEKDDFYNPAMGTCDEGEIIFDDPNEDKIAAKNDVDQDTLQSHLVLSKVEFKAANSESAFQSKGLEEFLGQKSELNIGLLSQYNPNVKVIEKDSPILAVGTLKKDDYVPPWKKLMERQRKRKELLASLNSRREAETKADQSRSNNGTQNEREKAKIDAVETELGNKIVWLDDEDSDSDQVEPKQTGNETLDSRRSEGEEEENELKFNLQSYSATEESETRDFENNAIPTDNGNKEKGLDDKVDLIASVNIKQEPIFEESTKENSVSDKSVSISPERAKREKKLSWKLLNNYEQPKKGKHKSPLLNADSNRKDSVEEPIKISLKHSPDRSSWVINNVISDSEYAARKKKGKRKIRNYSFIYSNDESVVKDNRPKFEIITQTVWSRNKVLEKEFYQFLTELRATSYDDAMRRYQCSTIFEDEPFPTLSEWDALAACHSLNMVPKLIVDKSASVRPNGTKLLPKNNSLPGKKSVSRLAQLQNSLRFMDVDASLPKNNGGSNDVEVTKTTSRGRITNPPKRLLDSTINIDNLSDDADDPCFMPTEPPKRKKTTAKSANNSETGSTISPPTKESERLKPPESISDDAIVLDDSSSGDETPKQATNKPEKVKVTAQSSVARLENIPIHPDSFAKSTSPVVVQSSPEVNNDDIIELPSPEANKSDEEVALVVKKRPKDPAKKRKRQNRELQKTLILKSFRQVTSGNTVLKSLIVANTNISSKVKDNMSLGLCAVGLTLNKANEGKNDIFLLYGRINDSVYNDAVRKSFYEEQHGIQTHHFVVPIVLEITKAAMKSSSDLKLVKIPLKGRALIDNQTESVPLMLYPVATKPPDEDLINYSSKNERNVPEVPSAIPKSSSSSQDSFASMKTVKEVRRPIPSLKKNEDVLAIKKKSKVPRNDKSDDIDDDIDILARSDEEVEVSAPPSALNTSAKKSKFMPQNRTEPICRLKDRPPRPLLPLPAKPPALDQAPRPWPISGLNLVQDIPRGPAAMYNPAPPRSAPNIAPISKIRATTHKAPIVPSSPVFSGTFGASKALATLIADSQAKSFSKAANITIKGITLNGTADDDATLVKKILSDPKPVNGNGKTKELKLLSTKQLSMISGIVESTQPDPLPDQGLDQELKSAAQAAWQLFGPCIVRRVRLKNGNVVYVYQTQNPTDNTSPPQQVYNPKPIMPALPKTNDNAVISPRAMVSPQRPKLARSDQNLVKYSNIAKSTKTYVTQPVKPLVSLQPSSLTSVAHFPALTSEGSQLPANPKNVESKKLESDTGNVEISSIPKGIVSPISIQPPPKSVANALPIEKPSKNKFEGPPSPPLSPPNCSDNKQASYNPEGDPLLGLPESSDPNTSVWISTDGEPCYVMRLDDIEEGDAQLETDGPQDDSKVPTIIGCFPISEEEFQKNDSSTAEAVT